MSTNVHEDEGANRSSWSAPPARPSSRQGNAQQEPNYDAIVVGFGPSGLSTAIALYEQQPDAKILIVEKQSTFHWKPAAFLPSHHMRTSFMHDLATLRNPKSEFSFVYYMQCGGVAEGQARKPNGLEGFLNIGNLKASREVWAHYLEWAARRLQNKSSVTVRMGLEALTLRDTEDNDGKTWNLSALPCSGCSVQNFSSRKVILALGGRSTLPKALESAGAGYKIVHSSSVPDLVPSLAKRSNLRIAVIGASDEAVEITRHLREALAGAKIKLLLDSGHLSSCDESPFTASHLTTPDNVAPFEIRNPSPSNTATQCLLDSLYQDEYMQRVRRTHSSQISIDAANSVVSAQPHVASNGVTLVLKPMQGDIAGYGSVQYESFDLVIACSGYKHHSHLNLLRDVTNLLDSRDAEVRVDREYKVELKRHRERFERAIWVLGGFENGEQDVFQYLALRSARVAKSAGDLVVRDSKKAVAAGAL